MDEAREQAQERGWDKLLLEYEIRSRGLTIDAFCDAVGICRATYQLWAIGKGGDWTRAKIAKTAEVLGLEWDQIIKIFFAPGVA